MCFTSPKKLRSVLHIKRTKRITPLWSQSNGKAERFYASLNKAAIYITYDERKSLFNYPQAGLWSRKFFSRLGSGPKEMSGSRLGSGSILNYFSSLT